MQRTLIQAKVLRCSGSGILAETKAKNQLDLFLGHVHPEYKKLKKGKKYQFWLDIYPSHLPSGQDDITENASKNYLLSYEFKGGSAYEGIVHGEIIRSYKSENIYKHWIKVDCGIVTWRHRKQIEPGNFVRIRARLDVEKIYDLDDNLIEP